MRSSAFTPYSFGESSNATWELRFPCLATVQQSRSRTVWNMGADMLKKLISMTLAVLVLAGTVVSTVEPAEAGGRGVAIGAGVAAGIIGLGILGATAAPRYYGPSCYPGPRQCDYVGRRCWYNRFGEYMCSGGEYRCYRPTICP